MSKEIKSYVKLQIKAGQANPSPPIGPALGQHGLNIMEFCKDFNHRTKIIDIGTPVPVIITVYTDKTFTFKVKTVPVSFLLKKFLNIKKGSANPSRDKIGVITISDIKEIIKIKSIDLTSVSFDSSVRTIVGTARSMGVKVKGLI